MNHLNFVSSPFGSVSPDKGEPSKSARFELRWGVVALIGLVASTSLSLCADQKSVASGQMMRPSPTPSTGSANGMPSSQVNSSAASKPATAPTSPATTMPPASSPTGAPGASTEDIVTPQIIPDPLMQTQMNEKTPGSAQPTAKPVTAPPSPNGSTVSGTIQYNSDGSPPPTPGSGGETSIMQALNESLMNGPKAAAIRAQLPVAKSGIAAATVSPNPILFFDRAQFSEGDRRIGPTFTIDWPWKLAFRMMAAIKQYDQTRLDLLTTLWQLRSDVRRSYTELVIAVEAQRTLTELYELTERLLEVSKKRFQAGDVPELDVLRAQLATSQADVDRNVGRQRIIRARQQLNIIMGRTPDGRVEVPRLPEFINVQQQALQTRVIRHGILPDFRQPVLPLQHYLDIAQESRYEIRSLVMQKVVNKWNLRNAYGTAIPDLTVGFGSSEENNLPSGPNLTAQYITINAEIPISNFNQGDIAKYKAAGRQLNYQMGSQKNQVTSDVASAYNNLLAAREKIRVYQEHVLRDSNEVARLSRRSYEVGQSDINSTLLAQQANVQIRQAYLDAVTGYQGAYTDLEQACGRPLE